MRIILITLIMLSFACSSDDKDNESNPNNENNRIENDSSFRSDTSESDLGTEDQGGDMTISLPSCDGVVSLDSTIPISPQERGGQLYSQTVWDGSGAWVVYAGAAMSGEPEAIWAARVDCKGAVEIAPTQISPANTADRHLQPTIDSVDGTTYVAWYSQDDQGATKLWMKTFSQTGASLMDDAVEITPTENNAPVSNLIWEPSIVAISSDRAAIAFSYGGGTFFVVGVQTLSSDGTVENFFVPVDDQAASQKTPTLGSIGDGGLVLSWVRSGDNLEDQTLLTEIPNGATVGTPPNGVPSKPLSTPNPLAFMSKQASATGELFQVFQVTNNERSDILVRSASNLASTTAATFGLQQNNFRPSIALGQNGGAVAWYRYVQSPVQNSVVVGRFDSELTNTMERTIEIEDPAIPPYGPSITHVEDDIYFVTWSEGERGSTAKVNAQFVQLTL